MRQEHKRYPHEGHCIPHYNIPYPHDKTPYPHGELDPQFGSNIWIIPT